jgi:quercetin dioxygenase-like cupin family protein
MKSNKQFIKPQTSSALSAARVEVSKGAITQTHSHETETIVIVLEGAWRFQLAGRAVTLKKDEVLRIPAHEHYSAEALADTVALKIASTANHAPKEPIALPHDDPDQYLWGV